MSRPYVVYGEELSLFTRKLEAALNFYDADYVRKPKTAQNAGWIEARSGTHQVPVLQTPEDWMLADTTPLIRMLDGRFPARRMFPTGLIGLLVHILEEYFDEWVSRVMVHYRWHYPESARFASRRIGGDNESAVEYMLDWGPRACRATGTEPQHQRDAAESEYLGILEAAEAQLKQSAYLLGDRPTALDCIVLGGLRAHTNMDPDPKRIVAGFPAVLEWCETRADQWDGGGDLAEFSEPTPFAQYVLNEMPSTYSPFALGNRDAQAAGEKTFQVDIYCEPVSYLSRAYPERSRQMLVAHIGQLERRERETAKHWLRSIGLGDTFSDGHM